MLLLRSYGYDSSKGIDYILAASVTHDPGMHIIRDDVLALLALCCRSSVLLRWFLDNLHKNPLRRDAVGLKYLN